MLAYAPILVALAFEQPALPVPYFVAMIAAAVIVSITLNPLLVLLHELGHALTAIALTPQRIDLVVGHIENPLTFSIGRIDARVCLWQAEGGYIELGVPGNISRPRYFAIVLAGPLASGLAAVGLGAAALATLQNHPFAFLVLGLATVSAVLGFLNLVPSTFLGQALPGAPIEPSATDGLLIWWTLRGPRRIPVAGHLTDEARAIVDSADSHARAAGLHDGTGTTHLLRALAESDAAGAALARTGADAARLADTPSEGDVPDGAAQIIARLAMSGEDAIHPVDLLRGILDDPGCAASKQLAALGVDRRTLRLELEAPAAA